MTELKDLKKLILLCRQQGVQSIRFNGVELHLTDAPTRIDTRKYPDLTAKGQAEPLSPGGITEQTRIITEELSEEQLLFYSASGNSQ